MEHLLQGNANKLSPYGISIRMSMKLHKQQRLAQLKIVGSLFSSCHEDIFHP